ncbi:MAG: hypothetical protein HXY34_12075 [Candidatus Thorarchaeota archaeon]|nr:hypothetical protein [Candidatus Thorarchaeota archaeon]
MNEATPVLFVGTLLLILFLSHAFILNAIQVSMSSPSARVGASVGFWGRSYSTHPRRIKLIVDTIGAAGCCTPLLSVSIETLLYGPNILTISVGLFSIPFLFCFFRPFWGGRTLEARFNRMQGILEAHESQNRTAEVFFQIKYNWGAFVMRYSVPEQMEWLERMLDSIKPAKKALGFVLAVLRKNSAAREYQIQFLQRLVNRPDVVGAQARSCLAERS